MPDSTWLLHPDGSKTLITASPQPQPSPSPQGTSVWHEIANYFNSDPQAKAVVPAKVVTPPTPQGPILNGAQSFQDSLRNRHK